MNRLLSGFIVLLIGLTAGVFLQPFILTQLTHAGWLSESADAVKAASGEPKILYWVAPMDANFRKDKPGLSAMGMDLVPFYDNQGDEEAGVVSISSSVQNNIGVRTSKVQKGTLDKLIQTVGYITIDEEKLHHIHTRVEGWVEKLSVKSMGDTVVKGQKLFELYSPTLVNAQEEYVTALKSKNSLLIQASKSRLHALGITPEQIAILQKTRKIKQRVAYYAPTSGFLEKLKVREGMFVKPSLNVISIAQIDSIWVIAEVFERQSGWVKEGQQVQMNLEAFPARQWRGLVDYIYPTLDLKSRTLRVRIRFDNLDHVLKPNMFANLLIRNRANEDVVYVEREAIIRNGEMDRVVMALGDGKFKSVAVRVGHESGQFITILEGLKQGDKIVTSAHFLIDSESSLTASFKRMEDPFMQTNQVSVAAEIIQVMDDSHRLTLQHEAIEAWGQADMRMTLPVKFSLSLASFKQSDRVQVELMKQTNGDIEITGISHSNEMLADNQAWITGKITKVKPDSGQITLDHEPVEAWGWPAMVMDFKLLPSLDISTLPAQQQTTFLVEKLADGGYQVLSIVEGK